MQLFINMSLKKGGVYKTGQNGLIETAVWGGKKLHQ
jgi:hypothetical protein